MAASGEKYFSAWPPNNKPFISHGLTFSQSCAHHAENTFHARRIYVVVSNSISKTENLKALQDALGSSIVGLRRGIRPHTPWDDVLELAQDIEKYNPELIVTLGAGSVTDAVKVASWARENHAFTADDLHTLWEKSDKRYNDHEDVDVAPCRIPVINIPTSLSGGEYTALGGATDLRTNHKGTFRDPSMMASLVVLDPKLTVTTPEETWLASGIRGVDHCVEGICGTAPTGTEEIRKELEHSLSLLLPNLLITKRDHDNLGARLQCMLAVVPLSRATQMGFGASHGIGHQLGPLGVGHGQTSCVMLPAVLKFNYLHGSDDVKAHQCRVLDVFWNEPTVVEALTRQGLSKETADAGDVVGAFVKELGLPRSLRAVGVSREHFESLAEGSVRDWSTKTNPVPLTQKDVLEILEMAADD